jgi:hypothetical protein
VLRVLRLCGTVFHFCAIVNVRLPASKDACGQCNKAMYGKQKFIKSVRPCASRYHLSCLNISEAEYSCYTATGESTLTCVLR